MSDDGQMAFGDIIRKPGRSTVGRKLQFHLRARNRLNLVGEYPEGKALDHMFNLLVLARPRHALRLATAPLQQMFSALSPSVTGCH